STGRSLQSVGNDVREVAIALVWLVGMTNAFNLLDNMDGLAATLAAIGCAYFAIDAVTTHPNRMVLVLSLAVGLACLGFLPFNLRPGRPAAIFMGDSGSQVLGFALAALGVSSSWKAASSTVATLLLPVLILAVPILDTTLVTVVRLLEGRSIAQGGRDHTSHRLVYAGLSERRAVVLLGVISAALGATSLAYTVVDDWRITLLGVLLTFALLVQFASFLAAFVVMAVVSSEVLAFAFIAATRSFGGFPRSVFVIDALVCCVLIGVSRFWERAVVRALASLKGRGDRHRTLIVGAGRSGRSLL